MNLEKVFNHERCILIEVHDDIACDRWFVYILRCADGSLYTGITTDVQRRVKEHNFSPLGAKYTRGRRPVTLVYEELLCSRSLASKKEYVIKRLSKPQKELLLKTSDNSGCYE